MRHNLRQYRTDVLAYLACGARIEKPHGASLRSGEPGQGRGGSGGQKDIHSCLSDMLFFAKWIIGEFQDGGFRCVPTNTNRLPTLSIRKAQSGKRGCRQLSS